MKFKNKTKKESGFTLVELIVAVGIFGILSVFVTGAFLNMMSVQKKADNRQQIMNDFRVALDLIGKEVVEGSGFTDSELGVNSLYFYAKVRHDMMGRVIQYKVVDGRIWKAQQDTQGSCQVSEGFFPEECFVPFTSKDVYVDDLIFYINNFNKDEDFGHPVVTVAASGKANLLGASSSFKTSVSYSPRIYINPEYHPPIDTTPPEVIIEQMDGININSYPNENVTPNNKITLSGQVRDPGGSGVEIVYLRVYYENETGDEIYTDSVGGFTEGSTEWFSWEFQNVEVYPANELSYIKVIATDFSDNVSNNVDDEVLVFSAAPPPDPSSPSLSLTHSCSESTTDVDYVKLSINSTDTDINHYEIYRDGNFLLAPIKTDDEIFYHDFDVSKGNSYEYEVVAVNTDWEFDVKSATSSRLIDLGSEGICATPEVTFFVNNIDCSLVNSPSIDFRIRSDGWSGKNYRFEILDKVTGNVVHSSLDYSSWASGSTYSWRNTAPSGLGVGFYEYEARVCFVYEGSVVDCSDSTGVTSGDSVLDIDSLSCVPPDTFFWESTGLWEDLMEYLCVINDLNNPAIQINFSVERDFPEGVRPFDTFVIYEREYSSTIPRDDFDSFTEIGSCAVENDTTAVYYCHEQEYPREVAHYEYMVRGYNTENTWFGEPSYIEIEILDCGGTAPLPATSTLACTENELDDYREAHITVDDSVEGIWHDPATILRFYRCTGDELVDCEVDYFAEHLFQDYLDGVVAVDPGPADGITHWYALETCLWDNNSCLEPIQFTFLSIDENACLPLTPMVIEKNTRYAVEPSCYPPGSTESKVALDAKSNNTSDLVYINIYRDGVKIANELEQGEVYTDTVENEKTYTYGFEACYPPADIPCGEVVEEDFTVVENICNPSTPNSLTGVVSCNDLGQIDGLTLTTSGSEFHDGYVIERTVPALPTFSTSTNNNSEPFTTEKDKFEPAISSSQIYTYRSKSFRGTLNSSWKTRNFTLNPLVSCEAPFALTSSRNYLSVAVTGSGAPRTSNWASIGVDPVGAFSSSVNFDETQIELELLNPMTSVGVDLADVTVNLSRNILHSPYNQDLPILSVEIPDKDYLGSNDSVHGANITVKGESEGFETDISIPLIIQWEAGSQD